MKALNARPVLAVNDLALTSQWFADVFECTLHEIDNVNWVFSENGDLTFMLGHCPDERPAREIGDHSYLAYIVVDDVRAVYDRAKNAGAEILSGPHVQPWGRTEMVLRAPEGHRFMVAQ